MKKIFMVLFLVLPFMFVTFIDAEKVKAENNSVYSMNNPYYMFIASHLAYEEKKIKTDDSLEDLWKGTEDEGKLDNYSKNWTVLDSRQDFMGFENNINDFSAVALSDNNPEQENIVIAFRGTQKWPTWLEHIASVIIPDIETVDNVNIHAQSYSARVFYEEIVENHPNANIYVTGHSLGGYLAQYVTYKAYKNNETENLIHTTTFNPLALWKAGTNLKMPDLRVTNYIIDGEMLNDINKKFSLENFGETIKLTKKNINPITKHSLTNFEFEFSKPIELGDDYRIIGAINTFSGTTDILAYPSLKPIGVTESDKVFAVGDGVYNKLFVYDYPTKKILYTKKGENYFLKQVTPVVHNDIAYLFEDGKIKSYDDTLTNLQEVTISGTPISLTVEGEYLYVPTSTRRLYKLPLNNITDKKIVWDLPITENVEYLNFEGPPAFDDEGNVFIIGGDYLYALTPTLREMWSSDIAEENIDPDLNQKRITTDFYGPIVGETFIENNEKKQYVYASAGDMVAVYTTTGKLEHKLFGHIADTYFSGVVNPRDGHIFFIYKDYTKDFKRYLVEFNKDLTIPYRKFSLGENIDIDELDIDEDGNVYMLSDKQIFTYNSEENKLKKFSGSDYLAYKTGYFKSEKPFFIKSDKDTLFVSSSTGLQKISMKIQPPNLNDEWDKVIDRDSDNESVATKKQWTIKLNQKIDPSTIDGAIYVLDWAGRQKNISVRLSENQKDLIIQPPSYGYESGPHTLMITKRLKAVNNKPLKSSILMNFNVK